MEVEPTAKRTLTALGAALAVMSALGVAETYIGLPFAQDPAEPVLNLSRPEEVLSSAKSVRKPLSEDQLYSAFHQDPALLKSLTQELRDNVASKAPRRLPAASKAIPVTQEAQAPSQEPAASNRYGETDAAGLLPSAERATLASAPSLTDEPAGPGAFDPTEEQAWEDGPAAASEGHGDMSFPKRLRGGMAAELGQKLKGRLSDFEHDAAHLNSEPHNHQTGAQARKESPAADAGDAIGQTLYISAKTADLFMDPNDAESMPEGYSAKDQQKETLTYDYFGSKKSIRVAKGSDLTRGEAVTWSGTQSADGKWLQVDYGGMKAWVRKSDLTGAGWKGYDPKIKQAFKTYNLPEGKGLDSIVALAKSRVGDQYVWGGASPGRFDCSGLMQWTYRKFGINIPRVSRDQQKAAVRIRPEDLQPGDMVFTGNPVKHVMMYAGNGQLVEAMGRRYGVVVSSLKRRTSGGKAVYYGTFRDRAGK